MTEQEEMAMLESARCVYVGRCRTFIASAVIAGERRRVMGSTFDGAFALLAALSITLTGCPPTAHTPDAPRGMDAPERDDAALAPDVATEPTDATPDATPDAPIEDAPELDAPFICEPVDACPPGYSWTPCGCATDCVPPACGADQ